MLAGRVKLKTFLILVLGLGGHATGYDPFNLGFLMHVSLGAVAVHPLVSDGAGIGRRAVPIPGNPSLAGMQLRAQGLWFEPWELGERCSTSALGVVTTRGLRVTVQP